VPTDFNATSDVRGAAASSRMILPGEEEESAHPSQDVDAAPPGIDGAWNSVHPSI